MVYLRTLFADTFMIPVVVDIRDAPCYCIGLCEIRNLCSV